MGERAKIILNEYYARSLLMKDTLDLDKFYTADLKLFVEVARDEIKRLKNNWAELKESISNRKEQIGHDFYGRAEYKTPDYVYSIINLMDYIERKI